MDGSLGRIKGEIMMDMKEVVGRCHILFVCIDSLRYDVAEKEQEEAALEEKQMAQEA